MSPRRIACFAGLSMKPSPHTAEVSTAELWFGKRSSPPAAFNFTRRNSRRASGFAQSKSARSGKASGSTRVDALAAQDERPHEHQEGHEARHRIARAGR